MFLFKQKQFMIWMAVFCSLLLNFLSVEAFAQEEEPVVPSQIPVSAYCFGLPDMGPVFSWSYSELPLERSGYSIDAKLKKPGRDGVKISIDFNTLLFEVVDYDCNCNEADCSLEITVTDSQGSIVGYGEGNIQKIAPSLPVISVITDESRSATQPVPVCPDGALEGEGCDEKLPADIFIYNCTNDASLNLVHNGRCGIEVRGNTSRSFPKKQYSLEMWDMEDEATDAFNVLDMGQGEDWILNGSWFDRSFIANKLAFEFFRSLSPLNFSVKSRYVELFVNHEFMGLYLLTQSIKREYIDRFFSDGFSSDKRGEKFIVSISSDDPELNYEERFMPFFAAERDNMELKEKLDSSTDIFQSEFGEQYLIPQSHFNWLTEYLSLLFYELKYPSKTSKLSLLQERNLIDYFLSFEDSVLGSESGSTGSGLMFDHISLSSAVDYTILQELFLCFDSYVGNFYLYRNQADGDMFLTVWDFDRALGNDPNTYWHYVIGTLYDPQSYIDTTRYLLNELGKAELNDLPPCLPEDWSVEKDMEVVIPRTQMFWEMLRTPKFEKALKNRINYLRQEGNPMSEPEIQKLIAGMTPSDNEPVSVNGARLTRTALNRNFERWPNDSSDYANLNGICAAQFRDYDTEFFRIENFLINRTEILYEYIEKLIYKAQIFSYENYIEEVPGENK